MVILKITNCPAELRAVLLAGSTDVLQNVSWSLRHIMGDSAEEPAGKAARWQTIVGPLFKAVWPLDAHLRDSVVSGNLVMMACECETAFPDAVGVILELIVPYQGQHPGRSDAEGAPVTLRLLCGCHSCGRREHRIASAEVHLIGRAVVERSR